MTAVAYEFVAQGQDDVIAAMAKIGSAAKRSANETSQAHQRAGTAQERAYKKAADVQEKSAQKTTQKVIAEAQKAATGHKSALDKQERATEAAYRKMANAVEREEAKRVAAAEKAATKIAAANAKAESRRSKEMMSTGWGLAKSAGKVALTGAALATGVVGEATRESMHLQSMANRLSINSREAGQAAVDPTTLRKEFETAAIKTPGIKPEDIAEAMTGFVGKTGDLKTARANVDVFATTASATGTRVQDVADVAADLRKKFDITDIKEMEDALAALTYQGKAGSFELKDAAAQFAKVGAAASRFGFDKGASGVKTLGGLTQIAREATGSSEQAATATERMLGQLVAHSADLKSKNGVEVFKNGKTRDIQDVLVDTISKVGGNDMEKKAVGLQHIFGEEGIRGASPLISKFTETFQASKGGGASDAEALAAAQKALRQRLDESINVAGSWADVQQDAAQAQQDASAKLSAAWTGLVATVGDEVTPQLVKMAPDLIKVAEAGIQLVPVFGAVMEGLGVMATGLVDFLDATGISKKKEMTPTERMNKAQKELDQLDSRNKFNGDMTPADMAKQAELKATVEREDKAQWGSTDALKNNGIHSGDIVGVGGAMRGVADFINDAKANTSTQGPVTDNGQSGINESRGDLEYQAKLAAAENSAQINIAAEEAKAKAASKATASLQKLSQQLDMTANTVARTKPISDRT